MTRAFRRAWLALLPLLMVGRLLVTSDAFASGAGPFDLQTTAAGATQAFDGYAVAIDASTAVVGAINDNGAVGAAYVYALNGSTWALQAKLTPSDGAQGDQFGYAVAVSGATVLVDSSQKTSGQGAVYVFTGSGTSWTQRAEFTAADGAANDCFGCALALEGTTAVVGANGKMGGNGAAYVFTVSGGTATQTAESMGNVSGEGLGLSVALSSDGSTALIGAPFAAGQKGEAYVFTLGPWTQQTILTASDGQAGDNFGYSVGVDGANALVGAYGAGNLRGAAYAFASSGTSWVQSAKLLSSDGVSGDYFGFALSVRGTTAVVGAYERGSTNGAAYAFAASGGSWTQAQELTPTGSGQSFGWSVALGGSEIVVGAFSASNDSGEVYFYGPPAALAAPALGGWGTVALAALVMAAFGAAVRRAQAAGIAAMSAVLSLGLTTAACSGGPSQAQPGAGPSSSGSLGPVGSPADSGSVGLELSFPNGAQIDNINWAISGPQGATTVVRSASQPVDGLAVQFLVGGIAPGTGYTIDISGTSSNTTTICTGSAPFNVTPRATTTVLVQLACSQQGTGGQGTSVSGTEFNCAAWNSVSANPIQTTVGSSVTLAAAATGPAPSMLTYQWTAPNGTFGSATSATSTFTCTTQGTTPVTLTVGDGPVPSGSACNTSADTTSIVVTCAAGPPPPPPSTVPAAPPALLALFALMLAAVGAAASRRKSSHLSN